MNSDKTGTYISIGLCITIVTLFVIFFGSASLILNGITGNFFTLTRVFVYGPPINPNLSLWTKDLGDYENGTLYLSWNPDVNISYYKLYMTNNYSNGFNFSAPNQTFDNNTLNFTDTDAADDSEQYYIIRANNTYNLSEYNTDTWGKFVRQLYKTQQNSNISLISLPLSPVNNSLYAIFIQNQSNYFATQVQRRNDVTGSFELVFYLGQYGINQWAGDFYTLDENTGYFVKTTRDYNISLAGEAKVENKTKTVYSTASVGNLIGYTSVVPQRIDDIADNSLGDYNLTKIQRRNDVTGSYDVVFYLGPYGINQWAGDFYTLEPGIGYWATTAHNTTLTYGANIR